MKFKIHISDHTELWFSLSSNSLLHQIKIQIRSVQVRSCPAFCTQQSCQPPQGEKWIPQVFVPLWCLRYCCQCKYTMLESRLLIWEPCACKVLLFLKATGSQELITLSPVAWSLAPQIPPLFTFYSIFVHPQAVAWWLIFSVLEALWEVS